MAIRSRKAPELVYERSFWSLGKKRVIGMDEVGRGSLSGPVVVAAVCFSPHHKINQEIRDSKCISPHVRERLCDWIYTQAEAVALGLSPVAVIDDINILEATKLAMIQAASLISQVDQVLVDGRDTPDELKLPMIPIIKGDQLCYSIAAASIVAKVARDNLMSQLDLEYPVYGWKQNKGYGTKQHRIAIEKYGPTKHHRRSFLKKILPR